MAQVCAAARQPASRGATRIDPSQKLRSPPYHAGQYAQDQLRAQAHWRAVNAPHPVALVRAGAKLENGKLVERPDESAGDQ
jgi:hypothetical protein